MLIKHKGQTVERIVRQSGRSLTWIAGQLKISRNTLYNRFNSPNLSFDFINKVGEIIRYDFAIEFPEMKKEVGDAGEQKSQYGAKKDFDYAKYMKEYFTLANQHRKLLEFLVKIANNNELKEIKDEIGRFVETSEPAFSQEKPEESPLSFMDDQPEV